MPGSPPGLSVGTIATPREQVEAALLAAADGPPVRVSGARPIAVGWATVELDRAAVDLATGFGLLPGAFGPAPRSASLGCACRVAYGILSGGASLGLLEPDTEGRLAAWLARLDEGPAVAWLEVEEPAVAIEALRAAGFATSAERAGPFGPEFLIGDGAVRGPLGLLVGPSAGTIRP